MRQLDLFLPAYIFFQLGFSYSLNGRTRDFAAEPRPAMHEDGMEHFSEQVWVDYVRGADLSVPKKGIEEHLSSRCPECMTASGVWGRIAQLAASERAYAAPEKLACRT